MIVHNNPTTIARPSRGAEAMAPKAARCARCCGGHGAQIWDSHGIPMAFGCSKPLLVYDWLVVTGTMDFYDFPYITVGIIIPTDELHDFSEGWLNHQPDELGDYP